MEEELLKGLSPEDREAIKQQAKAMMQSKVSVLKMAMDRAEEGNFVGLVELGLDDSAFQAQDEQGRTILHLACLGGNLDLVKYLVEEKSASLSALDGNRRSMLHVAAFGNRIKVAEWLILKGAKVDALDSSGSTPLHWATKKGHAEMVALLVDRGAFVDCKTKEGWTALHLACLEQHTDVAKWLVSRGSSTSAVDATGASALRLAVNHGNVALIRFFLERSNAGIEQKVNGLTLVDLASVRKFPDAVLELAKFGAQLTERVVKLGVAEGHVALINFCMDKGLTIPQEALHVACKKGNFELCQRLVQDKHLMIDESCVRLAKGCENAKLEAWVRARGPDIDLKKCAACGKDALKKCGKCKSVVYCNVECQKKDFKSHTKACKEN